MKSPVLMVMFTLLLMLALYALYDVFVLDAKLTEEGHYTVGRAIDTYNPPKGGTIIEFIIKVNGKEYTASHPYVEGVKKNSFYLVKFLESYPEKSEVLLSCGTLDSTLHPPSGGWETPPFECNEGD